MSVAISLIKHTEAFFFSFVTAATDKDLLSFVFLDILMNIILHRDKIGMYLYVYPLTIIL